MTAHVFLGPTLTLQAAREELDVVVHPPIQQGDVLRVLSAAPTAIGIVDGYFERVPSVWHKEILVALQRGVAVYGAASMGALRAAELEPFGMIGVGRVFEWFRSGQLQDDDEVAVEHGPAEFGYPALSEAMVNIRDALDAAVAEGEVSSVLRDALTLIAKRLHYGDRTWPRIFVGARAAGADDAELRRLEGFLAAYGPSLKERDAVAMLRRIASDPVTPRELDWKVERTVFLADLLEDAGHVDHTSAPPVGETVDVARKKALLRLLARREAERSGVKVTHAHVQAAADAFRAQFHLLDEHTTVGWLRSAGLTPDSFRNLMRDAAIIEALERCYAEELDGAITDQARLSSVRLWSRDAMETWRS